MWGRNNVLSPVFMPYLKVSKDSNYTGIQKIHINIFQNSPINFGRFLCSFFVAISLVCTKSFLIYRILETKEMRSSSISSLLEKTGYLLHDTHFKCNLTLILIRVRDICLKGKISDNHGHKCLLYSAPISRTTNDAELFKHCHVNE